MIICWHYFNFTWGGEEVAEKDACFVSLIVNLLGEKKITRLREYWLSNCKVLVGWADCLNTVMLTMYHTWVKH